MQRLEVIKVQKQEPNKSLRSGLITLVLHDNSLFLFLHFSLFSCSYEEIDNPPPKKKQQQFAF